MTVRFLRLGEPGYEIPAVATEGSDEQAWSLVSLTADIDGPFLASDPVGRVSDALSAGALPSIPLAGVRLGAPIARPHAIYAIGLNYQLHANETNMGAPTEPLVFSKAPNSISGPFDNIQLQPEAVCADWEVELGVVIGPRAYRLSSPAHALTHIAGYVCVNDVSERDWQFNRGGQWLKGKSAPTFNPTGPFLVTPDEVGDVESLRLTLTVNGEPMQDGTASDLIYGAPYLVWYLSQFLVLEPGDLVNTGTPAGVGYGFDPPRYLKDGDLVELSITHLGSQSTRVSKL